MAQDMDRQELAMRYLLGDLSETDEVVLGKRYLSEEAQFEELEIAEEELIDRHIRGELSEKDSSQFNKILGNSPRLRERVEFARILARRVASESQVPSADPESIARPTPVPKPRKKKDGRFIWMRGLWGTTTGTAPALRFAFSASIVLMLIATTALLFVWTRLQAESQRLAQEQQQREQTEKQIQDERVRSEQLQAELEQAHRTNEQQRNSLAQLEQQIQEQAGRQSQSSSSLPATIYLFPSMSSRGPGGQRERTLQVPRNASAVHVNLNVQRGDYPSYNVSLTDANNGRVVSQATGLEPFSGRKYIRLQVAPDVLSDGLYMVHVEGVTSSGIEPFGDYLFRVVRVR